MDKELVDSTKKNKNKSNKSQISRQKNHQNETEEKFVISTKIELTTKDNNDIFQDLSNTNKNLGILYSNKLQSFGKNKENKLISSNLIKKYNNNSNSVKNLVKRKNNFLKQSVLTLFMKRSSTEKKNDVSSQSNSILLNKETNKLNKQSSIMHLNNNKIENSNKEHNIKINNSTKSFQKKTKVIVYSNSTSSPCLSKKNSPKNTTRPRLYSFENFNKKRKNQNLSYLQKFENLIYNSDTQDENHLKNKQKHNTKLKKTIKKQSKKKLSSSKDNLNDYSDIIQSPKSIITPKNLKNTSPQLKQRKYTSTTSYSPTSQSNKNSIINLKSDRIFSPKSEIRSRFQFDKKNKVQRKKKKILTFSNCINKYNGNLKTSPKKNVELKTSLISNKYKRKNFHTILLPNKKSEIKDVNKIMGIITMDEADKKIKESIYQYDQNELIKEIHDLETNDICEAIEKLPITNNNSVNNDNKSKFYNKENNNKIIENNEIKIKKSKKFENIFNSSSKTKLSIFIEKYRKLLRKVLVYDSLDDEEMEEIEINFFYISPNSIKAYLIDTIILITSLIQLLYLPIILAYNSQFCRNIFSAHQLIFYLTDLFYILDLITGFFRAYYNFDEFLIKNKSKIFKNYLNNWFLLDFIEAIPIYIILNIMENDCQINEIYFMNHYNKNINKLQYILLLIKSLKIFKVFSTNITLKKLKSKLNDFDFFFEYKIVLFTIFIVFSSLNISSCLFIFVGRNTYPGWIIACNMQNYSFGYIYLTAVYYLITSVTTVGYGDIIVTSLKERIYQIIILIVGTCTYSWTISYISNYIKKIHEKSIDFDKKMSILHDIKLLNENFSKELYDKIRRYLQYNRVEKKNNNEILINCLPYALKNTLFMQMYKDIIQNFKFFKSFENSNFIVKVVTSLKPVLSVKNDILVQEGDFVEDIIFVKEGILCLEVCIDLDCIQESIEAYLNVKSFGSPKSSLVKKNKNLATRLYSYINSINSTNEFKFNEINKNFTIKKEKNENNKKYLRILDIRKNEYYGDVLMFLNERAPLRVKVKSKTAELFYLSKTDAVEISTLYPNIWKSIIQKSLFNMKQIRSLTRKILIYFSKLNGIVLNEEFCTDISSDTTTQKSFISDTEIIDNNSHKHKSRKLKKKEEKNKIQNNIDNIFPINEETNETLESILTNSKLKNEITDSNKKTSPVSTISIKKSSINHKVTKKAKNLSNGINNNQNQQYYISDIEINLKENNIENPKNLENKNIKKSPIYNSINSSSDYSDFKYDCSPMSHENEINSEIYPNENLNYNKYLQSDLSLSNKNSIDFDKEKSLSKKLIIKFEDNQLGLNDKNVNKCGNNQNNPLKINDKKIFNFENLTIVTTATTTISSIYENLNQITKYKFSKDINFRRKTIQLLMEESKKINTNNSAASNFFQKIKINNPLFIQQYLKKYPFTPKHKIEPKIFNNNYGFSSIISLSKREFSDFKDMKSIYQMERNSDKSFKSDNLKPSTPEPIKSLKKKNSLFKNLNHNNYLKNEIRNQSQKLYERGRKKSNKKKRFTQNLSHNSVDKELNFYVKMKTLRGNNSNNISTINSNNRLSSPRKRSYLDKISHNIFESRQTLKNPQEFYMDFFTNLVQKRINKAKKCNKISKEVSAKKIGEVNKNRIRNHKSLFDEEKIKNTRTTKRNETK